MVVIIEEVLWVNGVLVMVVFLWIFFCCGVYCVKVCWFVLSDVNIWEVFKKGSMLFIFRVCKLVLFGWEVK